MSDGYVEFSSHGLLQMVRRHLGLVVVCVLLGLALAGVRLYLGGLSYTATSQVLVGQPLTLQALATQTPVNIDQNRLIDATKRTLESDAMKASVERMKGVGKDGDFTVAVATGSSTSVMGIEVTADDGDRATKVANAYAEAYIAMTRRQNLAKVHRATHLLQSEAAGVTKQLGSATTGTPQRSALVQQQLAIENRLSQVRLAGAVDPAGGARVIQRADAGNLSTISAAAPLVLGALFGLLVGLGIAAARELAERRETETESDDERGPVRSRVGNAEPVAD